MDRRAGRLLLAGVISGLATGYPAVSPGLEEVVVTARKREESVQDVPVAVTALAAEAIERAVAPDISAATALTPGFVMPTGNFNPLAPALSMRGSVQNSQLITDDPSVGVYVDGLYMARPFGIGADILDMKQIQVVKGPQGTLFGRNSTAGALLITSNDPELDKFSGSVSFTGGTDDLGGQVVLNLPLGDTFAVRVAHQTRDRADYAENVPLNPNDPIYTSFRQSAADAAVRRPNGSAIPFPAYSLPPFNRTTTSDIGGSWRNTSRVKVLFQPSDVTKIVAQYDRFEAKMDGPVRHQTWIGGVLVPDDPDADTVALTFDPISYTKTDTFTLNLTQDLGGWGQLKAIAGYRRYRTYNEADYDGGDLAAPPALLRGAVTPATPQGIANTTGYNIRRHGSFGRTGGKQWSGELQWITELFDDRLTLTSGATYLKEDASYYDSSIGTDLRAAIRANAFAAAGGNWVSLNTDSWGLYSQGTFKFTDDTNFTAGVRFSFDNKSSFVFGDSGTTLSIVNPIAPLAAIGVRNNPPTFDFDTYRANLVATVPFTGAPVSNIRRLRDTFSSFDWMVSADHKFTPGLLGYVKISTGYRSGGFNGRGINDRDGQITFLPEDIIEYEAGVKWEFLDGRARWNTALFYNETSDKQFTVLSQPAPGSVVPGTNVKNAGDADALGLETELFVTLTDRWSAQGSFSWVDTQINSLESFNYELGVVAPVPDARLPDIVRVPDMQWTLALNYNDELNLFQTPLKLAATATYTWIDEFRSDSQNAAEIVYQSQSRPALLVFGGDFNLAQAQSWVDNDYTDAFGLMNLNFTFSTLDDRYSLTLWSRNLFDERAKQSTLSFINGLVYQYGTANYTEPRTFGATLKYRF
ncbi:MAG: TonB-dependent receptor [Gammaproteobacteria bacterium]